MKATLLIGNIGIWQLSQLHSITRLSCYHALMPSWLLSACYLLPQLLAANSILFLFAEAANTTFLLIETLPILEYHVIYMPHLLRFGWIDTLPILRWNIISLLEKLHAPSTKTSCWHIRCNFLSMSQHKICLIIIQTAEMYSNWQSVQT